MSDSFAYAHIIGTTAVIVSPNPGVRLHTITINGGFTGTITIADYNGSSGATATIGIITNPAIGGNFLYDVVCNNGLTITSSAVGDITVAFA